MPALKTQASIEIGTPMDQVNSVLVDFHTWPVWSPWLYLEPDTQVRYRGQVGEPGHGYDWVGNKVGAGGMTLTRIAPERIECDLQFLKPFKSFARVCFELEEISPGTTRVTWFMDSHLPFFMFFMTNTMNGMIRSDYRRGLALLKDHIEGGQIPSHSEFLGTVSIDDCRYVGYRDTVEMTRIGEFVQSGLEKLRSAEQGGKFQSSGRPFCFHGQMNYKRDTRTCTVALPTKTLVQVDQPLLASVRPGCSALKVVHTGAYRHLENAWAMLISESRHQKLKASKTIQPFEIYMNDTSSTAEKELLTELYLPLRG